MAEGYQDNIDAFALDDLEGRFEQPEPNVLISYIIPDQKTVTLAKTLFCALACEYEMNVREIGLYDMIAELSYPFSSSIKFSLLSHSTKGYLAILRYQKTNEKLSALSSLIASCPWLACDTNEPQNCKEWYNCKTHWQYGFTQFHAGFFRRFQSLVCQNQISYRPTDKNPVSLSSICLPVDTQHSSNASFHEKRSYYVDISGEHLLSQLSITIVSSRKIALLAKREEVPSLFSHDVQVSSTKSDDGNFTVQLLLHRSSKPHLTSGRWFFVVKGTCLFSQAFFTITASLIRNPPNEQPRNPDLRQSVSHLLPYNDEDAWVIVADESCPEGRKGKAELIIPFPKSEPIAVDGQEPPSSLAYSPSSCLEECDLCPGVSEIQTAWRQRSGNSIRSIEVPHHFLCPITRDLMEEPVVAADGHSYELEAITQWLETHIRSPMSGEKMQHKMLIPNFNLKSQIDAWRTQNHM